MDSEKYRILKRLLWPGDEEKYRIAEGNVESLFANRLLTEFADIPASWICHQWPVGGGRADIVVRLNNSNVLVIECKRAGAISPNVRDSISLREALNQGFGYAITAGAPLVMATNGEQLVLIDRHEIKINAQSREEILQQGARLLSKIRPLYLYYASRHLYLPISAEKAIDLLGEVRSGKYEIDADVVKELESTRTEFGFEELAWEAFRDEVLSWISLWQHHRHSTQLTEKKQNEIVHVDYSFVSYFEGSWYYDMLHSEVVRLEQEITKKNPGIALRVFVLKNRNQLIQEYKGFREILSQQVTKGYRVALLFQREWLDAGIVDSHVDIVGNVYAKIYFEVDKVLKGKISTTSKKVLSLRSQVLDVIYKYKRVFEPLSINKNSINELDEKLACEANINEQ